MTSELHPADLVRDWPRVRADDPRAEVARLLALALGDAMAGQSARAVGRVCGLDHATVTAILAGETWPDVQTIRRLEHGLGVPLWPDFRPATESRGH